MAKKRLRKWFVYINGQCLHSVSELKKETALQKIKKQYPDANIELRYLGWFD